MSEFREESEQHIVHRLESFADIVIGFSLAQMTLNFVLPHDVLDLFKTGQGTSMLLGFALTFAVVSSMWWSHHRMFTNYFVPTPVNIALVFCSLGGVTFLVFTLQVWIHPSVHHYVAYVMYSASIAWVVAIIAFLSYRGTVLRGDRMKPELAQLGRRRALRMAGTALAFAILAGITAIFHRESHVEGLAMIGAMVFVALVRFVEKRTVRIS